MNLHESSWIFSCSCTFPALSRHCGHLVMPNWVFIAEGLSSHWSELSLGVNRLDWVLLNWAFQILPFLNVLSPAIEKFSSRLRPINFCQIDVCLEKYKTKIICLCPKLGHIYEPQGSGVIQGSHAPDAVHPCTAAQHLGHASIVADIPYSLCFDKLVPTHLYCKTVSSKVSLIQYRLETRVLYP